MVLLAESPGFGSRLRRRLSPTVHPATALHGYCPPQLDRNPVWLGLVLGYAPLSRCSTLGAAVLHYSL
jgi:hypothetical protein